MKKYFLTVLVSLFLVQGYSQKDDSPGAPQGKTHRFFAGISYSCMSVDMELSSLTLRSVWPGSDAVTEVKTDDQIADINSYIDRYSRINAFCLQLGMNFLDKPDVKWKLSGSIFGGVAENLTTVTNTLIGVKDYTFNSGYTKPCLGLGFDLGYQINPVWGVVLRPYVVGTMGKSSTIEDLANPDLLNYQVTKENKYRTLYGKLSVLASFTKGSFTVFAGPGFYRIWSHHEYKRVYSQTEDWESITEEMTTDIVPKNFVDGNIAAIWRISDRFSLNALFGFGNDLNVNAGLHFNF